ncbi:hypothetical protein ACHAW6_004587 [Cyclotella cf. meneghiniana]
MAEQVQAILERMVAPLRDLRDRGIFSEDEIRSIVERRRQSEYLLQKRAALKADFLRYIEQEILLERLRKLRKQKVMQEYGEKMRKGRGDDDEGDTIKNQDSKTHAYQTSGPGDAHIVSNIHFLYQRLLKKFHYPLDVILNYADFAKEHKSFHVMSRVYAEGLQHHPREEGLWIQAASFEFFGYVAQDDEKNESTKVVGSSIQNARVLMQRGLRINGKTSQELWLQYFALELHYVMKLQGRKEILEMGASIDRNNALQDNTEESNDDAMTKISDTILLPCRIIYKNAIESIPNSVIFRLRFVEYCRMFPHTVELERYVIDSIERDFGDSVEAWVARISFVEEKMKTRGKKRTLGDEGESGIETVGFLVMSSNTTSHEEPVAKRARMNMEDAALKLLNQALDAVPSSKMYLECARYLQIRIQRLINSQVGRGVDEEQPEDISYLMCENETTYLAVKRHANLLKGLYARAEKNGVYSTDLTLDQVDFLVSSNEIDNADKLLGHVIANRDQKARLYIRWAKLSRQMEEKSLVPSQSPTLILRKGLDATPIFHRNSYLLIATELMKQLMTQERSPKVTNDLKSIFQKLLLTSQSLPMRPSVIRGENEVNSNLPETFLAYLTYTIPRKKCSVADNEAVRSIYNDVIFNSNNGKLCLGKTDQETSAMKSFFDACLHFENVVAAVDPCCNKRESKKKKKQRLSRLYRAAINYFASGTGDAFLRNLVDNYLRHFDKVKYCF